MLLNRHLFHLFRECIKQILTKVYLLTQNSLSNEKFCDLLPRSERSRSGVSLGDWVVHHCPQRSTLTNTEEEYAIDLAMAFCVCSVSDVDRWVMRTVSNRWFLFDKFRCFQTLTIDDRQECKWSNIRFKVEVVTGVHVRYSGLDYLHTWLRNRYVGVRSHRAVLCCRYSTKQHGAFTRTMDIS